jgi:hypothetical protein
MNGPDSPGKSGLLENRESTGSLGRKAGAPTGNDAWQRHVMAGLWILLAALLVISCVLMYANAHGLFADHGTPVSSWPAGWP